MNLVKPKNTFTYPVHYAGLPTGTIAFTKEGRFGIVSSAKKFVMFDNGDSTEGDVYVTPLFRGLEVVLVSQ
jgi:hypothetical protein